MLIDAYICIIILNSVIIPTLHWILPDRCPEYSSQELCSFVGTLKFYSVLRHGLVQLFYVTWFYPLYIFSIILSNLWYELSTGKNRWLLQVYVTGYIPYVGKAVNFLLLSWMYAYYCFEYKWNFSEVRLEKRLDFFESNWAFFAGFDADEEDAEMRGEEDDDERGQDDDEGRRR
ncbi:protein EI24 homolog [Pyrus x bretschneideri]|uniref:protein EI24 homolog n=1 Tax=Pyrus x bretschneideri TaxID=225117 RepID=UPI00202F3C3D|nr:protein EI24 homolog [Pyrus x bretschneideri]